MRLFCLLAFVSSLFCSPTLANDDARVGTVVDRQGTALVRPVGRDRWTPVGPKSILMPGDLVRTPVRGANAVEVRLAGKGRLVVGPGSLVEIEAADSVKLYRGDIEASGVAKISGPGAAEIQGDGTQLLRSDGKKIEALGEAPRWLTGYRNSTTDEWMGSLVAQVDGRDVPLSVGYHKVTVDIRDQIARTTIEQSFVNSTKSTLEGVFYFPLPADASISGFGSDLRGHPAAAQGPGPARVVGRQPVQGARLPDLPALGKAHSRPVHPGPSAGGLDGALPIRAPFGAAARAPVAPAAAQGAREFDDADRFGRMPEPPGARTQDRPRRVG
ncbi:MAG: VIT domain-containing protein [Planctomycetota bacterium]|jgi:hypothetical protein